MILSWSEYNILKLQNTNIQMDNWCKILYFIKPDLKKLYIPCRKENTLCDRDQAWDILEFPWNVQKKNKNTID